MHPQQYIQEGWSLVPLPAGQKKAIARWAQRSFTETDFPADAGIAGKCGEPSGWRVDVDLDCIEAIHAASHLLPATGLVHGRPSKPCSHYWYIAPGAKSSTYTDTAGGMLCEVRSTGGYTVLPPSLHPSGEVIEWFSYGDPLEVTAEALESVVRDVALASLCIRHYPPPGTRHHALGHLAGFFLHGGLSTMRTLLLLDTIVTLSHDPDVNDRKKFIRSTVAKYTKGEPVTGGPKLVEAFGEAVVQRMRGWLKLADVDALAEMNARHFIVRLGKDEVVATESSDGVFFQYPRSLSLRYANRKVSTGLTATGKHMVKPLFTAWLESKDRRDYRGVVFAPPPLLCDPRDYNLWKGLAIQPAAGDCGLFLQHCRDIICSGVSEHYDYLLKLLAYTLQSPGTPSGVAVVLRGEPGTGKGIFVRGLSEIFGQHACHLDRVDHLVGHFNSMLSSKVLVFADEAFWAGDKREIGALKRLITEPTLTIERKGMDATQEANCVHLFMATNEEWSVPAQLKERRFFALHCSNAMQGYFPYFQALADEMQQGGLAALVDLLLQTPVTADEVRNVPRTRELRVQQDQSLSPELNWWQECLWEGLLGTQPWTEWVSCAVLYDAYAIWLSRHKGRLMSKVEFGRRLSAYISGTHSSVRSGSRCWQAYPLNQARDVFDERCGTLTSWDAPIQQALRPEEETRDSRNQAPF